MAKSIIREIFSDFTLVEVMIVIAISGIITAVLVSHFKPRANPSQITGQTQCIEGFKFIITTHPVQLLDENGKGIRCDSQTVKSRSTENR